MRLLKVLCIPFITIVLTRHLLQHHIVKARTPQTLSVNLQGKMFGKWSICKRMNYAQKPILPLPALKDIFQHISLPISELWKPQSKQNEGFDFHTVCDKKIINFGEAKFLSPPATSPVSAAANQANQFFTEEKHFRDRVHLVNLVHDDAISNLDKGLCGMVVAFSMNAINPLTVYKNAISKVESLSFFDEIDNVYIVGVSHGH